MNKHILELIKDSECAKKYFEVKLAYNVGPYELNHLIEHHISDINIIDLRKYDDYLQGHIPFAIHVPAEELEDYLEQFEYEKTNILYCYRLECQLAKKCCLTLAKYGYPVVELLGGFKSWQEYNFDVVKNTDDNF